MMRPRWFLYRRTLLIRVGTTLEHLSGNHIPSLRVQQVLRVIAVEVLMVASLVGLEKNQDCNNSNVVPYSGNGYII